MKRKRLFWLMLFAALLMPLRAFAATEGDVYAALRSIGVPEEYVGQAAGMLARGTSDGAGVYRSDGTYYSYSYMVSYIYANQDMLLAYCGVLQQADETGGTDTAVTGTAPALAAESGETAAETSVTTVTTVTTTTTTTTAAATTAAAVTTTTAETTETETAAASPGDETAHSGASGIVLACCMILTAGSGFGAMAALMRKNQ